MCKSMLFVPVFPCHVQPHLQSGKGYWSHCPSPAVDYWSRCPTTHLPQGLSGVGSPGVELGGVESPGFEEGVESPLDPQSRCGVIVWPEKAPRGGIPCPFLEPYARFCQLLARSAHACRKILQNLLLNTPTKGLAWRGGIAELNNSQKNRTQT